MSDLPKPNPGFRQRLTQAVRYTIAGVTPQTWMSPMQPLQPMAPEVKGRLWDFPVAFNLNYLPRAWEPMSFSRLKHLSHVSPILRMVLETRKDQIESLRWNIQPKVAGDKRRQARRANADAIDMLTKFWEKPDRRLDWQQWIRSVLEQHFVYDAVALYKRRTRGGQVYGLEQLDAATISVKVDADGRIPAPPSVAYQQVLKGVPASDYAAYTAGDMIYAIKNARPDHMYGYGPVEQIAAYVELSIGRVREQLAYYQYGDVPRGVMEAPASLTQEQVNDVQGHWDSIFRGNIEERARLWWVPAGSKYTPFQKELLFDEFDAWLAKVICYAFSISPQPFIKQMNRATAQTSVQQAQAEGLQPTMRWIARLINKINREELGIEDLEFTWQEDREFDPIKAATIDNLYVRAGIESIDEVRDDVGLDPIGGAAAEPMFATATGYVPLNSFQQHQDQAQAVQARLMAPAATAGAPGAAGSGQPVLGGAPKPFGGSGKPGMPALPKPSTAPAQAAAGQGVETGGAEMNKLAGTRTGLLVRPLINVFDLQQWGKQHGFDVPSNTQVEIASFVGQMGLPFLLDEDQPLLVVEGDARELREDDDGWHLVIHSPALEMRARALGGLLASELSISLGKEGPDDEDSLPGDDSEDADPSVEPYAGLLLFGPEVPLVYEDGLAKITAEEIDTAAAQAHPAPTLPQRQAGNYCMGHFQWQGLDITIENAAGSVRQGKTGDWASTMMTHYGYIRRTVGADEQQMDVFIGSNPDSDIVFVMDQVGADGAFDEHKCFICYDNWIEAQLDYVQSYDNGAAQTHRLGPPQQMTVAEFKHWLTTADLHAPKTLSKWGAANADSPFDPMTGAATKAFNSDQPRDDHGRWSESGASAGPKSRFSTQLSWEAAPGRTMHALPEFHNASLAQRQAYHDAIEHQLVDAQGRDVIATRLGLETKPTVSGPGVFEGHVNPSSQAIVYARTEKGGDGRLSQDSKDRLDVAQAVRGALLRQDASAWHSVVYAGAHVAPHDANLIDVNVGRPLTNEEAVRVNAAITEHTGSADLSPITTATGFRVLNIPEYTKLDNATFQGKMAHALIDVRVPSATATRAKAEFGYIANDWQERPRGQNYLAVLRTRGRSDLSGRADRLVSELGPKISSVEDAYAARLGWTVDRTTRFWETGTEKVLRKDFNPDQPRDEHGQWTGGGGGSTSDGHGDSQSSSRAATGELPHRGGVSGSAGGVASSGAADSAHGEKPLEGLPGHVKVPGVGPIVVGPNAIARQAARDYMQKAGLSYTPPTQYVKVDPVRATRIADEFDRMKDAPHDPVVKAAYGKMIEEVVAQYQAVKDTGLKVEFIDYAKHGDPYAASPRLAALDVEKNNHLWVFPTSAGFGSDAHFDVSKNPLLAPTKEVDMHGHPMVANDVFRVVHDYFGHIKEGNGFRADGEENAWRSHVAMFSPEAARAMTTETRGQNSWVNYGPYGESNRTASSATTHFADQKIGLMPEWTVREGAGDLAKRWSRLRADDPLAKARRRRVIVNRDPAWPSEPQIQAMADVVKTAFDRLRHAVVQAVGTHLGKADPAPQQQAASLMASVKIQDELHTIVTLEPVLGRIGTLAGQSAVRAVMLAAGKGGEGGGSRDIFDTVDQRVAAAARARSAELIGMRYNARGKLVPAARATMRIDETTRTMLREGLGEAISTGMTAAQIQTGLMADTGELAYPFSAARALTVARTEAAFARGGGALEGYKATADQYDLELQKRWVGDDPCREICQPNVDQDWINLDDAFDSGDDTVPAHPNCRCDIEIAVIDPDTGEPSEDGPDAGADDTEE